ncbi:241_t:CDS:2 [Funneliformis caledonium]|uniref:241_t:CDS:1 n=1 Tax=Funneliformis caledonium TaxID=1117310 RepID=A0A9N9DK49_9GLOM|nr:241_t:CDS:2 [Funneliformis caledonium]
MHPFIVLENLPFMALTTTLIFVVAKITPENIYLCIGFITIWFFLWDVKRKNAVEKNSRETKINTTIAEQISKIKFEINSRAWADSKTVNSVNTSSPEIGRHEAMASPKYPKTQGKFSPPEIGRHEKLQQNQ